MIEYDFHNSIRFIINRIEKTLIYIINPELRELFCITFDQWKMIIILVNNDECLTQKEIAVKLVFEGPTLIPIIDKLEKDGFAIRKVNKNDRRINRLFLTEKAYGSLDDMIESVSRIKKISLNDISGKNVSTTKNTLEKIWFNIQKEFKLNCSGEYKQKRNSNPETNSKCIINIENDRIIPNY